MWGSFLSSGALLTRKPDSLLGPRQGWKQVLLLRTWGWMWTFYPSVFPQRLLISHCAMRKPLCMSEGTLCITVCDEHFCKIRVLCPQYGWEVEEGGVLLQNKPESWKLFNPEQDSWPWNTETWIGQRDHLGLLQHLTENLPGHFWPLLSHPVFWTKLQVPPSFHPFEDRTCVE